MISTHIREKESVDRTPFPSLSNRRRIRSAASFLDHIILRRALGFRPSIPLAHYRDEFVDGVTQIDLVVVC